MGLLGNILIRLFVPKSKFDVLDIRKEYCLYIQNMMKIYLMGFPTERFWGKSLEISRSISIYPLSSKYN